MASSHTSNVLLLLSYLLSQKKKYKKIIHPRIFKERRIPTPKRYVDQENKIILI